MLRGLAIVCMIASNLTARAGAVSHGTYYAFWFDPERIVIAIDSRQGDTVGDETVYRDDKCKLLQLGNSGIFFAEGIIANSDLRAEVFDGFSMASKWHASGFRFGIQAVADAWANEMAAHMQKLYPVYPQLLDARHGGEIVNAHFVGFDAAGRLDGIVATVKHEIGKPDFSVATKHLSYSYTLGGHGEAVNEFMQGETSRAVAVREQVRQESEGKSTSERYAIELRELVRNVPTWANDLSSGGDVAVAILETSTKTLNWLHRPAFCH